jgi:hypothetical protein
MAVLVGSGNGSADGSRIVVNALRTQALEEDHVFDALDLPTKRSKSNSVNSRNRNDLERSWGIGWVFGTEFATT